MNSAIDPTRLYTILIKTGLQTKDPNLYQLLYNLIGNVVNLRANAAASGSGSGSGGNTVITNIQNLITSLGDSIENTEMYMINQSSGSVTPAAATYDSPLTNGDPLIPEIIFDSNGDVVMVTGIPL